MFFNPLGRDATLSTECDGDVVYKIGEATIENGKVSMKPQSFLMIANC